MSDRYTLGVEGPDGWTFYEVSDQQIGLIRAGVPAQIALASSTPLGRSSAPPRGAGALVVDRSGAVRPAGDAASGPE